MSILSPKFTKAVIDEVVDAITAGTSHYYAIASNPAEFSGDIPDDENFDLTTYHQLTWMGLFGKKLANTDFCPMIANIPWVSNTVYDRYDNQADMANASFYIIVDPEIVGGNYLIYKCIDNANGAAANSKPTEVQASTFTKADGYSWRYITSIPTATYEKFATTDYVPIKANTTIVASASDYASIDLVIIDDGGEGYNCYHDGLIRSVTNTTVVQIDTDASLDNNFYTRNGIYIYNDSAATSQMRRVSAYTSNLSGNWVTLDVAANTDNILPGVTQYRISPYVDFDTNGDSDPIAYSTVNTIVNSIASVVILDPGVNISRANVSIESNTTYGTGAEVRCVTPPPGGHGFNPVTELLVKGLGVSFTFANSESNTIPTNVLYNRIGLLKNPYALTANSEKGDAYTSNTFNLLLKANVSPSHAFTVGEYVQGNTSEAIGLVAFANSTVVHLVGDRKFSNGETITANSGSGAITITSRGDCYMKDVIPMYAQNIDNVDRGAGQTEGFKIIIEM